MSGERNPRVGDLIHDEDTGRRIVMDVEGGAVWVLRPESGPGQWISRQPERLTVVATCEGMLDRL
ncbi:hypothetical protein [Streptomyces sp. RTd22]|uniref:hypothetical protein n=1 Tax=Streptomyces sp. RTd22 TaxID=1841249 RepID=UPI0007C51A8D|nr:hypothetical protein [Streptomyces sp. RTd22]